MSAGSAPALDRCALPANPCMGAIATGRGSFIKYRSKKSPPRFAWRGTLFPSVQLALRHRRLELRDLGGLRRLAVEGQHIAFARYRDLVAVLDLARQNHLGERIL